MREKFKQLLNPSRDLPVQFTAQKKFTSVDEVRRDIFLKKYKLNKNDNISKRTFRKLMASAHLQDFECYKKRFLQTTFVRSIWHKGFNSNIILSLLENFGWNLVEEKLKIQLFNGDVCPASIESVCLNYEEEKNSGSEYESDSNIL